MSVNEIVDATYNCYCPELMIQYKFGLILSREGKFKGKINSRRLMCFYKTKFVGLLCIALSKLMLLCTHI